MPRCKGLFRKLRGERKNKKTPWEEVDLDIQGDYLVPYAKLTEKVVAQIRSSGETATLLAKLSRGRTLDRIDVANCVLDVALIRERLLLTRLLIVVAAPVFKAVSP